MRHGNHGGIYNPSEITKLMDHVFNSKGDSLPVCIWGGHGVGKTELVKGYCREKGWQFAYCAPAQFEEMGDLHGMPEVCTLDADPTNKVTKFFPPEWVPVAPGPGVLLLDDFNRAEDRILRGIMQLFQTRGLFSWKLPEGWKIVCTANPDNGVYSVTTLDDAMLTRMFHCSMEFNANNWANWALANNIDSRGIDFVLAYPEAVTGKKTTPRSLVQFFNLISGISDLQASVDLVSKLARGLLDEQTVSSFMSFVRNELECLLSPIDILQPKPGIDIEATILNTIKWKDGHIRVDRLSTIIDRLLMYLASGDYKFNPIHCTNLARFIEIDGVPRDLKTRLGTEISKLDGEARKLHKNKAIADVLLATL